MGCASLDDQLVGADPKILELTRKFVCVRVVQMGGVDLALFQFDPFLSWAVVMMNADKVIYGRYGTAHPATKRNKKDSNPSLSAAGLRAALEGALEWHERWRKAPAAIAQVFRGKTGSEPPWRFAEKTPAAKKTKRLKVVDDDPAGCIHCHLVQRTAIDSYFMTKRRIPDSMLWLYPRPSTIGLEMDTSEAATVRSVEPGSIAAKAGLQRGDKIQFLGGEPVLSIADLVWVLHTFPDEGGPLEAKVERDTAADIELELPPDWRHLEDFGWRYRMAGYAFWLWGGHTFENAPNGVRVGQPSPGWFKESNRDAQDALDPGDVIVKVDGREGMDRSEFLAYLMRDKKLGSKVELEILRGGKTEKVSFRIPKEQPLLTH